MEGRGDQESGSQKSPLPFTVLMVPFLKLKWEVDGAKKCKRKKEEKKRKGL